VGPIASGLIYLVDVVPGTRKQATALRILEALSEARPNMFAVGPAATSSSEFF
jgi:hypothetical protein